MEAENKLYQKLPRYPKLKIAIGLLGAGSIVWKERNFLRPFDKSSEIQVTTPQFSKHFFCEKISVRTMRLVRPPGGAHEQVPQQ